MKQTLKISLLIALITLFSGCKKTPEEKFQDAIQKYAADKDLESKIYLTRSMLENSSFLDVENFSRDNYIEYQNCIYSVKEKKFYLENRAAFSPEMEISFAAFSTASDILVYSDGFSLYFKTFGDVPPVENARITDDDEISIDGLTILDRNIFFFYKRNIYRFDIADGKPHKIFSDETFSPPFAKNIFLTNLIQVGAYVGVSVGNAGSYNISLLNSSTGKVLKKNIKAASGQMKFYNNSLYFISGATGKWKIESYGMKDGAISTLIEFKTLKDIRFSGDYIFIREDDYYYIYDMTKDSKLPFFTDIPVEDFKSNYLVLKYMDKYYFSITDSLYNDLNKLQAQIPGFLTE